MDINGKKISKQKCPNSPPCHYEWLVGVMLACGGVVQSGVVHGVMYILHWGWYKPSLMCSVPYSPLLSAQVPVCVLGLHTCLWVLQEVECFSALQQAVEELAECSDLSLWVEGVMPHCIMEQAFEEYMFNSLGLLSTWACSKFFGGEVGEFPS